MKYSLRTLFVVVTLVGLILGSWLTHRDSCLRLAATCDSNAGDLKVRGINAGMHSGYPLSNEEQAAEDATVQHLFRLSDLERKRAEAYRKAIWFPWLRWTIEELPTESP